jgi:hypothetical protein
MLSSKPNEIWPEEFTRLGIQWVRNPKGDWELVCARFAPEIHGSSVIQFVLLDENGQKLPLAGPCMMDFPGSDGPVKMMTEGPDSKDKFGMREIIITGELNPKKKNGPHIAYVEDLGESDEVKGLGRVIPVGKTAPEDTSYQLTFKRRHSKNGA